MNKQNLWFITLFSIILVLSIYYISMPSNILEEYQNPYNSNTEEVSSVITEESSLVALRVSDDEKTLNTINELQTTILDNTKSLEEKNDAYEKLKNINSTKGLEEEIESILRDEFNYDSFVKINKDQVNIVISSTKHDKTIANNVIKRVQSLFDTKKYITIKFQ